MSERMAFKPIPTENTGAVLRRVLELVRDGTIAFVGTNNEHNWKCEHDSFKMSLSRSKAGNMCLAVYPPQGQALFIRTSGGGDLGANFHELFTLVKLYQELVLAPAVLEQLKPL